MAKLKHNMEPARGIVDLLGGGANVARELCISRSTVTRWMAPKSRSNAGGRIPQQHWYNLLALAKKMGKPLTVEQLAGLNVAESAT